MCWMGVTPTPTQHMLKQDDRMDCCLDVAEYSKDLFANAMWQDFLEEKCVINKPFQFAAISTQEIEKASTMRILIFGKKEKHI